MAQRTKRNQNVVHTGGGVGALAGAGDAGDKKDQGLVAASVMDTDIVVPRVGAPAEAPPLVADDSTKDKSSDVKNWSVDEVVRWAKQAANLDDEDLEVLRKQKVKGRHLEGLTKEELQQWGMAGAPAKDLMAAIDTLLGRSTGGAGGQGVVYAPKAYRLSASRGKDWTYQVNGATLRCVAENVIGQEKAVEDGSSDKQERRVFVVASGSGTGKSRMLDEFKDRIILPGLQGQPKTLAMGRALTVLKISFENGAFGLTDGWTGDEELGTRLGFYSQTKYSDYGLYKAKVGAMTLSVALQAVMEAHDRALAGAGDLAPVLLLVDGMQGLIGGRRDTQTSEEKQRGVAAAMEDETKFENAVMAIRNIVADARRLVIAVCGITVNLPFRRPVIMERSPAKYVFLSPPSLDGLQVLSEEKMIGSIFGESPVVQQLVQDMGGHPRAMEALVETLDITDKDVTFSHLSEAVLEKLMQRYPGWRHMTGMAPQLLAACLSGLECNRNSVLDGRAVDRWEETGLVRLEAIVVDSTTVDGTTVLKGRIVLPFILVVFLLRGTVWTEIASSGYEEADARVAGSGSLGLALWQRWESFVIQFLSLREMAASSLYGSSMAWHCLHNGATFAHNSKNPHISVMQKQVVRATRRVLTGNVTENVPTQQVSTISPPMLSFFVQNAEGAPSADAFTDNMIAVGPQAPLVPLRRAQQFKHEREAMTSEYWLTERLKARRNAVVAAASTTDAIQYTTSASEFIAFELFCTGESKVDPAVLGPYDVLVHAGNAAVYFGPLAGRAFFLARRIRLDINTALMVDLTAIHGVGATISKNIMVEREKRPFASWQDVQTRVKGVGDVVIQHLQRACQDPSRSDHACVEDDSSQGSTRPLKRRNTGSSPSCS